jgi:hypothetical protein
MSCEYTTSGALARHAASQPETRHLGTGLGSVPLSAAVRKEGSGAQA